MLVFKIEPRETYPQLSTAQFAEIRIKNTIRSTAVNVERQNLKI